MAISLTCPSCKHKFKAPDSMEGRKVKCPECAEVIRVKVKGKTKSSDENERVEVIHVEEAPAPRLALALGVPSVLFGIVATLLPAVQYFLQGKLGMDWLSLPFSGLGLLLGIAALIVAVAQGSKLTLSIFGISLCMTALGAGLVLVSMGPQLRSLQEVVKNIEKTGGLAPQVTPKEEKKSEPPPPDVKWVDASKEEIRQGDIAVLVKFVGVSQVKTKGILEGDQLTQQKYLGIQVQVKNQSKTKKVDLRGWSGASDQSGANINDILNGVKQGGLTGVLPPEVNLWDDHDNSYARRPAEFGETIEGQLMGKTSVYPGKSAEDLILFEVPIDKVKYLRLELDASAYGGAGKLRFQIPGAMIRRG